MMRLRLQVYGGLMLLAFGVSYPIAWACQRFLHMSILPVLFTIAVVVLLVIVGLYMHYRRRDTLEGLSEASGDGERMNVETAATRARTLLLDSSKFTVVWKHADDFPLAHLLARRVREFFNEIESVQAVRGGAMLLRSAIATSELNSEYICIGRDIESIELVVRPDGDVLYEIDSFDPSAPFDEHRSIYHWLIAIEQTLYGT